MGNKGLRFAALMLSGMCIFSGCGNAKSDEQLITERIQDFTEAYNSGDFEETLKSMDSKTRNTYQAAVSIGSSLLSDLAGINLDYSDLFAFGVGTVEAEQFITFQIENIDIEGKEAVAETEMAYDLGTDRSTASVKVEFELVKEKGGWYIKDIHDM